MASAFSADPSVLSHLRPLHLVLLLHSLSLCPPPPPCASLTFFPSCPKGSTIFIATFLSHMIPQCRVWSQQKAITLLGLNIRCEQEGNSWRRGRGQGEGGGVTELWAHRQKAERRKQKLLSRLSLLSQLPIPRTLLRWEQRSVGFLIFSPDTRCPKDCATTIKRPGAVVRWNEMGVCSVSQDPFSKYTVHSSKP